MPKSRIRRTTDYTPPTAKIPTNLDSKVWVAPTMLAAFFLGLAWIIAFYVTGGSFPIEAIHNWNLLVGFGFIAGGFAVATQWK